MEDTVPCALGSDGGSQRNCRAPPPTQLTRRCWKTKPSSRRGHLVGGTIAFYPELCWSLSASRMENDTFVVGVKHAPLQTGSRTAVCLQEALLSPASQEEIVLLSAHEEACWSITSKTKIMVQPSDSRYAAIDPTNMVRKVEGCGQVWCALLRWRQDRRVNSVLQFPKRVSRMMWRWPDSCSGFVQAYYQHHQVRWRLLQS